MTDDRVSPQRPPRRPQVFKLDDKDSDIALAPPEPPPEADLPVPVRGEAPRRSRFGMTLGGLFWTAAGGVASLALYVGLSRLVSDLYAQSPVLGYVGLGLSAALVAAGAAVLAREGLGLARLAHLDKVREKAADALAQDDRALAEAVARDMLRVTAAEPTLARARGELQGHLGGIIDGADLVRLTERTLLPSLDARARQMVAEAAKNVSVVTAVSPRALVDLAFVLYTAVSLMRRLAQLYGGRPGALGMVRLVRHVLGHLAITGGMAAGDTLVQQIIGQGLAARLSAKLGEGVVNGLLTARLGLAAIAVTRPLPFTALPAPRLADVATGLLRKAEEE
ncbi:TIGR01620 family protein [Xanthobacter sp. V0B-10]|uniref:YcjF family protein n=1 Tax=Xanthobacter albus TaxID=3119929 RepID=UPI0037262D42